MDEIIEEPDAPEAPLAPGGGGPEQFIGPYASMHLVQCQRCFEWIIPGDRTVLGDPSFPPYGMTLPLFRHHNCPVPYVSLLPAFEEDGDAA